MQTLTRIDSRQIYQLRQTTMNDVLVILFTFIYLL